MMKRWRMVAATGLLVLGMAAPAAVAGGEWRSVAVRDGALRQEPMPFSRVLTLLPYGERVEVLTEQGAWSRIRNADREGWMHGGSLIAARIQLQAGDQVGVAASRDELSLGGKGFSPEVEASYRAGRPEADYLWVDRMEQLLVSSEEILQFLAAGGLNTGTEGGGDEK